ncbi:hypothetical protein IWW39_001242 [Coemansia spiralis]|uniref:Fungal-type protein kinase domain-containing protein n=1 Tax=Coemansia spiralis TaxID=417178 RepID=A0A9W8GQM4_9FUNG|nr:hypothetical protein IWW39_001242 [Coemansia spiralis]
MSPHSREDKTELRSSPTLVDPETDRPLPAGVGFGLEGDTLGIYDGDLSDSIQHILHHNCDAVCKLAAPRMPELSKVAGKIGEMIAADMEAHLLRTTRAKGRGNSSRNKGRNSSSLYTWALDILEWTKSNPLPSGNENDDSDEGQNSDDSELVGMDADYIAPFLGSFMLFVAHHINEYFMCDRASGLLGPEDSRLILPIASCDMEDEDSDASSVAYVDPADFAAFEYGMFSIGSGMERQVAPAPHLVVGSVEVLRHKSDYGEAEQRLAKKTKALFFSQHNRRFAWGLTARSCTVRTYVFGMDDIWASTDMDIASTEGRQALVSLLVDWSLCPVDCLGFDPSIRYSPSWSSVNPYLEIDAYEVDENTSHARKRTYYSQWCVGAADRLTGRRTRYFAASTDPKSMGEPAFLIKDVWSTSGSGSANDTRESSVLNILHAEFDRSSEFSDSFAQLVSAGPVGIRQGDAFVADTTDTAFAGLPSISQARQHRRTVTKLEGSLISEADDENQVVVAIADAMTALTAAYAKCKILHGNISDRAILLQKAADGIKGVLADFDYASIFGSSAVETPESMLFQSILSLENSGTGRSPLDDAESLFYLACILGTFGINRADRADFVAGRRLPISSWNKGVAEDIASIKRFHMSTVGSFDEEIQARMHDGPLRDLALDMYRALFRHPGTFGTRRITNAELEEIRDDDIAVALWALPVIDGRRDPLALRNLFMDEIIRNLLEIVAQYRNRALVALHAGVASTAPKPTTRPSAGPLLKHYRDEVPLAGPSKRPH